MKFDLAWAVHWTFVSFRRAVNRINGHRAWGITATARIYAYTATHRTFVNVRIKQIHEAANEVKHVKSNSFSLASK